jgi:RimJ/RimL family protein N-acetyltransferase
MDKKLIPHWDAANERSARLAMRLGFKQTGSYYTTYLPA